MYRNRESSVHKKKSGPERWHSFGELIVYVCMETEALVFVKNVVWRERRLANRLLVFENRDSSLYKPVVWKDGRALVS